MPCHVGESASLSAMLNTLTMLNALTTAQVSFFTIKTAGQRREGVEGGP